MSGNLRQLAAGRYDYGSQITVVDVGTCSIIKLVCDLVTSCNVIIADRSHVNCKANLIFDRNDYNR